MSARIRFATARSVYEAFDDLWRFAPPSDLDRAPLDYAGSLLASERPAESLVFLAHLLPRREAVWWARQCVAAILGGASDDAAFRAAGDWVRAPEESLRRAALEIGNKSDQGVATTWLALAAGWSGGSLILNEENPVPPPSSACAKAANAAIVLAAHSTGIATMNPWFVACADAGIRFADGGEARIDAPPERVAARAKG